jgi:predicted RNase H-like nuclease
MIAVDIPIGLAAPAGRGGPAAENMVRPLLGERQSFAFSVPFATATQLTVLKLRIEFGSRGIRYAREHEREQGIFWRRTAKHFGT